VQVSGSNTKNICHPDRSGGTSIPLPSISYLNEGDWFALH